MRTIAQSRVDVPRTCNQSCPSLNACSSRIINTILSKFSSPPLTPAAQAKAQPPYFSIGQLRKSHCVELIQAGEVFNLVIATMRGDSAPKSCQWQMHHDLQENEFALVHEGSPREVANNPKFARIKVKIETRQNGRIRQ